MNVGTLVPAQKEDITEKPEVKTLIILKVVKSGNLNLN